MRVVLEPHVSRARRAGPVPTVRGPHVEGTGHPGGSSGRGLPAMRPSRRLHQLGFAESRPSPSTHLRGAHLGTLVAHPDRKPVLGGRRKHLARLPVRADVPGPGVRHAVAARDRGAVEIELRRSVARAEAEVEASSAHQIDDCRFLGDLRRRSQRCHQHGRADAGPPRARRHRRRKRQRLREVPCRRTGGARRTKGIDAQPVRLFTASSVNE